MPFSFIHSPLSYSAVVRHLSRRALSYQFQFVSSGGPRLPRPLHLLPPQTHAGRGAAVHVDNLSRDEVGVVGGEEGGCGGDVLRVADPAGGDEGVAELGGVAGGVEVAGNLYKAGPDGVDPDPTVGELDGQLSGEGVDRAFGGGVGRVPREPRETVDRCDVHDAPAPSLQHEGQSPAGAEEISFNVEVEHLIVGGLVGV